MNSSYGKPLADDDPTLPPRSKYVNTFVPWPTLLSTSLRLKFFLTGVVFPVICLGAILFGATPTVSSPWQSGDLKDFILVLVSLPTISVFFPLLIYSFVCLSVWCYRPVQSSHFGIWVGLVTGVILACMFMILLSFSTAFFGQMMAGFVAVVLAIIVFGAKYLIRKRFSILYLLIVTTIVAATCAVVPLLIIEAEDILGFFGFCLFFVIGGAPTLGMITFLRASVAAAHLNRKQQRLELTRRSPSYPTALGALILWLTAFAASWKFAIDLMLIEYAKLPTNPPNCYISRAAANGHRHLVKSIPIELDSAGQREAFEGNRVAGIVNLQMQRLKFLEFALATLCPKAHRAIRFVYNFMGPFLARVCESNVWFSDLTYLALKPPELLAVLIRVAIGASETAIRQIYHHQKID